MGILIPDSSLASRGEEMYRGVVLLIQWLSLVTGHGNMVVPFTWHDTEQLGMGVGRNVGCVKEELPDQDENYDWPTIHGRNVCQDEWFTNHTHIPGEPTIPEDMLGPGNHQRNPWFAPGTAPIFSPCGTYGGNPNGCTRQDREEKYGDCCSEDRCGGFALGPNAEDLQWPDAAVTEWVAGSVHEVAWYVGPNHGGGYSYRLCKLPEGGSSELTEECFQNNTLDFVGDKQWIMLHNEEHRTEVVAKRTREGTYPPGSQWTKNPLRSNQGEEEHGHVIDYVEIPSHLEQGRYVLSFRWDCQQSSQIWNVCANIDIA